MQGSQMVGRCRRIVLCGYMIRLPLAGSVLAYFHYLLGLHRLGYEVAYIEESGGWAGSCYDPDTQTHGDDPSAGLRFLNNLIGGNGMGRLRTAGCAIALAD
jgi:hypothetical protein